MPPLEGNIIWQYWETRGRKPGFVDGLHHLAKRNAGARLVLVTPDTLRSYLPDIEDGVLGIAEPTHKADMIRTRLVERYGGMWLDSDAVVLRDLEFLFGLLKQNEFVGFDNSEKPASEPPRVRVNCFLSRPQGRIVSEWVRLQRQKFPRTVFTWSEIGVDLLNAAYRENKESAAILPFEKICPVPWREVEAFVVKDEARAERILRECFIVMLTNRALRLVDSPLLRQSVAEIAAGDHLLGAILRKAIAFRDNETPAMDRSG